MPEVCEHMIALAMPRRQLVVADHPETSGGTVGAALRNLRIQHGGNSLTTALAASSWPLAGSPHATHDGAADTASTQDSAHYQSIAARCARGPQLLSHLIRPVMLLGIEHCHVSSRRKCSRLLGAALPLAVFVNLCKIAEWLHWHA